MKHYAVLILVGALLAGCGRREGANVRPSGDATAPDTEALKVGSRALQRDTPPDQMNVYMVGFHPLKKDPFHQMEAHHFCRQVNEDFAQCALFDGNTKEANLNGIEYIISEKLFNELPANEKQYWHPHNYEILSGQLVAPGLPDVAEKEFLRKKMNSYGKTWHVWMTGSHSMPADKLPVGEPHLAWSFNRDGEADPQLIQRRDDNLKIDSKALRSKRQDLVPLARPQIGVDAMKGMFRRETREIAGVKDAGAR